MDKRIKKFELIGVNKKTGKILEVNLIEIQNKKFNSPDEKWGVWHNYSKRGGWLLMQYTGTRDMFGEKEYEYVG